MKPEEPITEEQKVAGIIDFHYIKSNNFITHQVDGVLGGATPNRKVFLSIYVERGPIPLSEGIEFTKDGTARNVVRREGKLGVVREIQAGMLMDSKTARAVAQWLTKQADVAETP